MKPTKPTVYRISAAALQALWGRQCWVCDAPLGRQSFGLPTTVQPTNATNATMANNALSTLCCPSCQPLLPGAHAARCRHCGLKLGPRLQQFGWRLCRHCRQHQPDTAHTPLRTVVCADYAPPVDTWIQSLKYGQNPGWARGLGQWLAACWQAQHCLQPTVLLPVPSHPMKVQERGYNQAHLLARVLGQQLGLPVDTHTLVRTQHMPAQAGLGREGRWHNLHGAFACTRALPPGAVVALVDDVITTGATLDRCEEALRKAAQQPHLSVMRLAIARTPE